MSTLVDKYNIINTSVFSDVSEECIYRKILTNQSELFDCEKILSLKREVKPSLITNLIKHQVKEFKKELTYQISRNKNFDITDFTKKISDFVTRIRLIGLLNNRCLVPNNEKIFGQFLELDIFVDNFKQNIMEDKKIRFIFFKNLLNEKQEINKFIKLVYFLDKYNSFYEDFLDGFGEYILSDNFVNFGKGMEHLELYNLYENFLVLKTFRKVFKSDKFLKQIKIKLLDVVSNFISTPNSKNQKFIINNPKMCKELITMSDEVNYKQDLLVDIFVLLDKDNFLVNNLVTIFDFVSKLNSTLDQVKTSFVKKILMKQISTDNSKLNILVDFIISGKITKKFINLISSNDLVVDYIHEQIKIKLSKMIINEEINVKELIKLAHLFEETKFKKLYHDLSIIVSDNDFSKKFSKNLSNNFNINMNVYALNANFWALNFTEGFIECKGSLWDLSTSKTDNFNNLYQLLSSSYSIATDEKRRFRMIGHLGNVEFDYKMNSISKKIRMLPIQSYLFQIIYDKNNIDRKDLVSTKSISNYSFKFINELIDSLIVGKIIVEHNGVLSVNNKISNIDEDYVEILYADSIKKVTKYQPVYNTKTIISCWINKFLKNNTHNVNTLFQKISKELNCGVISITKEDFDKSVSYMINNEYIESHDNMLTKIVY